VVTDVGSSCVTCGLAPDDQPLINYPSVDSYGSYRAVPAEVIVAEADEYVSRGISAGEARDIERYAHFRVSEDEEGPALAVLSRSNDRREDPPAAVQSEDEAAPGS
jgi:hypothetical protein